MGFYRKGSAVFDIIVFIVIFFAVGATILIINLTSDEINTEIQADASMPTLAKNLSTSANDDLQTSSDWIFKGLALGSFLFMLISAYFTRTHPIMLPIAIFFLILFGFFSIVFTGAWQEMTADSDLSTQAADFAFIDYVMEHLTAIVVVVAILMLTLLYFKRPIE